MSAGTGRRRVVVTHGGGPRFAAQVGELATKPMTPELLDLVAARFKALSEPARLRLLNAMRGGARTVTELVGETHLGQTNVSKHLALLRSIDLVSRQRVGAFVYYAIADPRLYTLCDLMCEQLRIESLARQEVL